MTGLFVYIIMFVIVLEIVDILVLRFCVPLFLPSAYLFPVFGHVSGS